MEVSHQRVYPFKYGYDQHSTDASRFRGFRSVSATGTVGTGDIILGRRAHLRRKTRASTSVPDTEAKADLVQRMSQA